MIQHWESGHHVPALANFSALARSLSVSMDVLFYGETAAPGIAAERAGADPPSAGG
jgi:hypothetical protein